MKMGIRNFHTCSQARYTISVLVFLMSFAYVCISEESFVSKAKTVKGLRKHARLYYGIIHYRYTHYFVRLREGRPPEHYHPPRPTGNEMLQEYLERLRQRRIYHSLWMLVCICYSNNCTFHWRVRLQECMAVVFKHCYFILLWHYIHLTDFFPRQPG